MDQTAFIVTRSPTKTEEPALLELIGDRKVKIIINLSNTDWIPWQVTMGLLLDGLVLYAICQPYLVIYGGQFQQLE